MAQDRQNIDTGDIIYAWKIPEFVQHERSPFWYIISIIAGVLFLIYAIFTSNFLFAVILVIGGLIIIMNEGRAPLAVDFAITDEGLTVGRKFYDYDEIKVFSIVYKPRLDVKNIYFEFKSAIRPRLSIPLENMDPVKIRETMMRFLPEDLERTDQPISESLSRIFKL